MGNFASRSDREKVRKEKLSAYFYDMSKLCFGGMVVGSIMQYQNTEDKSSLFIFLIFGSIATLLFSIYANKILRK